MKRQPSKTAQGAQHRGMLRIVVAFDPETFAQIRAYATTAGISFGEAVRQLVEFGLIDIGEAA